LDSPLNNSKVFIYDFFNRFCFELFCFASEENCFLQMKVQSFLFFDETIEEALLLVFANLFGF
jgi:hypothetical protein